MVPRTEGSTYTAKVWALSKLRERVVNYDTLSPSSKPHSTNTGLGPLAVRQ
jgi:hypothetical protein